MIINTLGDISREHARLRPNKIALTYADDSRTWTFGQIDSISNRVANALLDEGIGPQDRVAYLDKNAPEYFAYLMGGAKINAVSVAVNWRLAAPEMEYILNNSKAKVLLIGEEFLDLLATINLKHITRIIVLGNSNDTTHTHFDQWIASAPDRDPHIDVSAQEVCYQLYTSGTTGLPKGVEITHSNFMYCITGGLSSVGFTEDSVNLVCMPLFHISGSGWGVIGMYYGAHTVLLRDVDMDLILSSIPQHGVTESLFVPAVLQFLLDKTKSQKTDFSSLKSITYGASPITEEVLLNAMSTFQCDFIQVYGLTETTGGITVLLPEDHDPGGPRASLLRSCGKAVAHHEVGIFNKDTKEPIADGEVGEIWIRGPQIMYGYYKNEKATTESILEDGWFRSGDAGYMIDGYLFIHDRVKDMIISGAENVYPAEVENVLMKHPQISDAAVIGVPSERWGETVKAIVTRNDKSLTEKTIIDYCRENLAVYKCPTSVDWMETIPRNPSGKILKVELRKPYWKDESRQIS